MPSLTRTQECLRDSDVAAGIFISANSPSLAELVVRGVDVDFVAVELQHASVSAEDSAHLLRAIEASDPTVTPFVRLPNHDVYWIQQSLDAGYEGLIVPLVESAEQAEALVQAAYFPPRGARSTAGSIRAYLRGLDPASMNERMILLPQIESREGLEQAERILDVDGVTGVLLGPEDLSLSCGWDRGNPWSHQPFLDAVARVVGACHERKKVAAILTGGHVDARRAGFDIIGFGSDIAYARVNMVADFNSKLEEIRSAPVSRSRPAARSRSGPAERIEAYEAALERFNGWVTANLDEHGSWRQPSSADGYFTLLGYGNYIGRRDWTAAVLRRLRADFTDDAGRLKQGANRAGVMAYVPCWIAWGAFDADAFDVSNPLLDDILSYQCPRSGGLFAGEEGRRAGAGPIDFDSTAMAAIALARCGRVDAAVKAADFLLHLYRGQPAIDQMLRTAWDEPDGLVTDPGGAGDATILRWSEPRQHYYKVGLLVLALTSAYGVTGQQGYLDAAAEVYRLAIDRASDLWSNTLSHKMCWAGTTLYTISGEKSYIEYACRFADRMLEIQREEGCFAYPEMWETFPPERWDGVPNIGCQLALWIARVLSALRDVDGRK